MQFYNKTHPAGNNKPIDGKSIGLSRNQIIENLKPGSIFINDNLFLYTIENNFKEISFYMIFGRNCVSEIIYDVETETILLMNTGNSKISKNIKNVFENNIEELKNLKKLIYS